MRYKSMASSKGEAFTFIKERYFLVKIQMSENTHCQGPSTRSKPSKAGFRKLFIKGQIPNVLGFVGHVVSVTTNCKSNQRQ